MWNTNQNKNLNKLITKMQKKDSYFCTTIAAEGWIHVSVGVESAGVEGFYSALFMMLGIEYRNTILQQQHQLMDRQKKYQREYRCRPSTKERKSILKSKRIQKMVQKEHADKKKGFIYQSDIAGPKLVERKRKEKNALAAVSNKKRKNNDSVDGDGNGNEKATTAKNQETQKEGYRQEPSKCAQHELENFDMTSQPTQEQAGA